MTSSPPSAPDIGHPEQRVSPAHSESISRGFITFLGGPLGHHARIGRQAWWTPLRTLILTSLVFLSFGYLAKANCTLGSRGEDGMVGLDWSGNRQYASFCYNDIVPLYGARGLDEGGFPYAYSWQEGDLTRYMEYPVLGGLFQGLMGFLTRVFYPVIDLLPGHSIPESGFYFALTAAFMSLMWVITIRMMAELAGNRIWDVVLVAASPLVIMHAFTNWDIPSIMAVAGAVLAVKRGHPLWAGILIGLGTAFKLWPLYILGAYLVLTVRNRTWGPFLKMLGAAIISWLLVNIPVMLAYPAAWNEFLRLNRERSWEWTTIYAVISRTTGWPGFDSGGGEPTILNTLTLLLFIGACLAIAIFGISVQRRPRVAELIFLIVAAFLLVNKVWSPQYSLWLVIPAVLALPRWRLLLTWMIVDALVWPVLMLHMMGTDNKGLPGGMLDLVILTRDGLIITMMVLVVLQMLGRIEDKVSQSHHGLDPLAGAFGQVDRFRLGGMGKNEEEATGGASRPDPQNPETLNAPEKIEGGAGSETPDASDASGNIGAPGSRTSEWNLKE
ncbi:hypothetical protein COCCU_13630 [Corynebacterium occultum]|uniref:DUF2029 domain-containing protein n=1 Tax=Corynebacterium occultum TaxID=2675219 RepID=A0A6B8WCJ7_9CORY|nr:glycosyltransferase family 87 protein [Corynebacterium occultum]QGU08616.1 hypothetical protein COCCU_13630 [Corynebacterium occultum]